MLFESVKSRITVLHFEKGDYKAAINARLLNTYIYVK